MFVLVSTRVVPAWAHATKVRCVCVTAMKTIIITATITTSTNTITNTSIMSQTQCTTHKASVKHKYKTVVGMLAYLLDLHVTWAMGTYD